VERIKALDSRLLAREGYEFKRLWWNLNTVSSYLRNNAHMLVNYGARHRKGLPISSSIAESAVNHVVSHRMAKKRQMRWTDEGAHRMAQVRVAVLNGEFSSHGILANVDRRAPANGQNRQCSHAVSRGCLTKRTSPTFARSRGDAQLACGICETLGLGRPQEYAKRAETIIDFAPVDVST